MESASVNSTTLIESASHNFPQVRATIFHKWGVKFSTML